MDAVFKALADPTRRGLLDELFKHGRADAERARGPAADDALRRDEAPARARGGRPGHHEAAWPREAPLPEPGPDPARPRPVGEQVRRALGGDAERAQDTSGGRNDGNGQDGLMGRGHGAGRRRHQPYSRSSSRRLPSGCGRRSPIPSSAAKYSFGVGTHSDWTPGSQYKAARPRRRRHRRRREPRGRPAAPPGADLRRALERRGQGPGDDRGSPGRSSLSATPAGSP